MLSLVFLILSIVLDWWLTDPREPSWIEGAIGEESLQIEGEKGKRYHAF
jgi:hypothetical protein